MDDFKRRLDEAAKPQRVQLTDLFPPDFMRRGPQGVSRNQRLELRWGPVPDPETLRAYNEAIPGCGNDLVKAFTKGMAAQRFRQIMEPLLDLFGMMISFALVAGAGWVGYLLLLADKDTAGWTALSTGLAVILVAFWGRKKRS